MSLGLFELPVPLDGTPELVAPLKGTYVISGDSSTFDILLAIFNSFLAFIGVILLVPS